VRFRTSFFLFLHILSFTILSPNQEEEKIINLLYKNKDVKLTSNIPILQTGNHKETFNTYLGVKDSRFLNFNSRENGIDVSKKILFLKKNQSVEFIFQKPLNHTIKLITADPSKLKVTFNQNPLNQLSLVSKSSTNHLKFFAETDLWIQKLFLVPNGYARKQNDIIFIVIDSLRGDVPGFNGGKFQATPHLDEFSKDTYVLQNHLVNSSWTRPSTLIFFTGIYPSKSYINFWDYPVFKNEKEAFYSSTIQPLPALLSEQGYRTVLIGNNPFFTDHRYIGVDVGFEEVYEFSFLEKDTPLITKKFHAFWDGKDEDPRPIFLFLNYNDPHKPYEPPFSFTQNLTTPIQIDSRKKNYLGEVAYVDSEISTILKKLKSSKTYSSMMILLTSDHGEVMQESHAKSKFTDVYTLYGHGQGLYEEDIHTPLLLKLPDQTSGKIFQKLTRSIDLYPTILDYSNISYSEKIDGTSLRSILEDRELTEREYFGESRGVKGVRKNGWKYMKRTYEFHREGPAWDGRVGAEPGYLYNLKTDPGEVQPIQNKEIEKLLIEDFSKGNQSKNLYHIRINSKDGKKKEVKIWIQIPYGSIREESKVSNSFPSLFDKIYLQNLEISENTSIEKVFSIYPDVIIPKIQIFSENKSLTRGELGVGMFDLYPNQCALEKPECYELYISNRNVASNHSGFRVQVWMSPASKKISNEKVILEKEAIDILKRQGYIQ
jgi:arylsulfatase A-like enzyme